MQIPPTQKQALGPSRSFSAYINIYIFITKQDHSVHSTVLKPAPPLQCVLRALESVSSKFLGDEF